MNEYCPEEEGTFLKENNNCYLFYLARHIFLSFGNKLIFVGSDKRNKPHWNDEDNLI